MAPAVPWASAMTNWPRTVPRTMAAILARYKSVASSPSGLSLRISSRRSSPLTSSEMNTYRKMIADVRPPNRPPAAPCRKCRPHSPARWAKVITQPCSCSGVMSVLLRNGRRSSSSLRIPSDRSPRVLRSVLPTQSATLRTMVVICTTPMATAPLIGMITMASAANRVTVADRPALNRPRSRS